MGARLVWDAERGEADISIVTTTIETGFELETAAVLSTFSDRRANDDDVLPPGTTDRRGHWADELPGRRRHGTRLWLLMNRGITPGLMLEAEEMVREGLEWFVEDGIADSVDVEVVRLGINRLGLGEIFTKGDTRTRFDFLWSNIQNG